MRWLLRAMKIVTLIVECLSISFIIAIIILILTGECIMIEKIFFGFISCVYVGGILFLLSLIAAEILTGGAIF